VTGIADCNKKKKIFSDTGFSTLYVNFNHLNAMNKYEMYPYFVSIFPFKPISTEALLKTPLGIIMVS